MRVEIAPNWGLEAQRDLLAAALFVAQHGYRVGGFDSGVIFAACEELISAGEREEYDRLLKYIVLPQLKIGVSAYRSIDESLAMLVSLDDADLAEDSLSDGSGH